MLTFLLLKTAYLRIGTVEQNTSDVIDYLILSSATHNNVQNLSLYIDLCSDHPAILLNFSSNINRTKPKLYRKADWYFINSSLSNQLAILQDQISNKNLHPVTSSTLMMGISRKLIRWIRNFLYQRKLIISINDQFSDPITPIHGVPQGSPLSPVLFIFYACGIPQPIDAQVNLSRFADDIVIWAQAPGIRSINLRLQKYLNQILTWGDR